MRPKLLFVVLTFLAMSRKCDSEAADQCPAQQPIYDRALKGFTFKSLTLTSSFECLVICHYEDRCQSYNYATRTNVCEMNNRTKEAKPEQFVSDPERFYVKRGAHRKQLGSIPLLPAQSCKEIKANEGGQVVSSDSWLDPTGSGEVILAYCDMNTEVADFCIRHRCHNGGTCVNGQVNYTCVCNGEWTGSFCESSGRRINDGDCNCSSELNGTQLCKIGYRLVFPEPRSTDNYAMKQPAIGSDLSELSVCFFVKIVSDGQEHSVISYAKLTDNDLSVGFWSNSTRFWVNKTQMIVNMLANSTWHHFCFTWENTNGTFKAYKDGRLENQGVDFQKGYIVRAGGIMVLGQDQDSIGGGFNTNDSFVGELTEVNMWDRVLSERDIAAQYENCSIPHGSVLAWPVFKDFVHGQVQVVEP